MEKVTRYWARRYDNTAGRHQPLKAKRHGAVVGDNGKTRTDQYEDAIAAMARLIVMKKGLVMREYAGPGLDEIYSLAKNVMLANGCDTTTQKRLLTSLQGRA